MKDAWVDAMAADFAKLPRRERFQFLAMMYMLLANAESLQCNVRM